MNISELFFRIEIAQELQSLLPLPFRRGEGWGEGSIFSSPSSGSEPESFSRQILSAQKFERRL